MESVDLTSRIPKNSLKALAANWGPLSEIILSGILNLLKTLSTRSCAVCSAVIVLLQGIKITPFVCPWSTTERIELKPLETGRSVMKSAEICANGQRDFAPLTGTSAGFEGCLLILNCWQTAQPFT